MQQDVLRCPRKITSEAKKAIDTDFTKEQLIFQNKKNNVEENNNSSSTEQYKYLHSNIFNKSRKPDSEFYTNSDSDSEQKQAHKKTHQIVIFPQTTTSANSSNSPFISPKPCSQLSKKPSNRFTVIAPKELEETSNLHSNTVFPKIVETLIKDNVNTVENMQETQEVDDDNMSLTSIKNTHPSVDVIDYYNASDKNTDENMTSTFKEDTTLYNAHPSTKNSTSNCIFSDSPTSLTVNNIINNLSVSNTTETYQSAL